MGGVSAFAGFTGRSMSSCAKTSREETALMSDVDVGMGTGTARSAQFNASCSLRAWLTVSLHIRASPLFLLSHFTLRHFLESQKSMKASFIG